MNNTITLKTPNDRMHLLVPVEAVHGTYSIIMTVRKGQEALVENSPAVFLPINRG